MTKVYVVLHHHYSESDIDCVFANEADAKVYVDKKNDEVAAVTPEFQSFRFEGYDFVECEVK